MARWFLPFTSIDPKNLEDTWEIGILQNHYNAIRIHGHEKQIARIVCVDEVLADPASLFRGWNRPDKDNCFVYAGFPENDFKSLTISTSRPRNMIFLVFVLEDGTINDWNWREIDADAPMQPMGINGELIWTKKDETNF